jgi:hypothetical protein
MARSIVEYRRDFIGHWAIGMRQMIGPLGSGDISICLVASVTKARKVRSKSYRDQSSSKVVPGLKRSGSSGTERGMR